MDHKKKCNELKQIRKSVADALGIDLKQRECTFQGECKGTCPKCMQEEKTLNKALLGGTIAATSLLLTACTLPNDNVDVSINEGNVSRQERLEQRKAEREEQNKNVPASSLFDGIFTKTDYGDDMLPGEIEEDPSFNPSGDSDDTDIIELEGDVAYEPESMKALSGYNEEEIITACQKYTGAPNCEIDDVNEDGLIVVHCYENVENEDEQHVATWDWITVNPFSGIARTFLEEEFNVADYIDVQE